MPVDPVLRAHYRLTLLRFEQDWFSLLKFFDNENQKIVKQAKVDLLNQIMLSVDIFKASNFILSDDFSMLDCVVAPFLWKLPEFEIELPRSMKSIKNYIARVSERESFKASLSKIDFISDD